MEVFARVAIPADVLHLQSCLDQDEFHNGQKAEDWNTQGKLVSYHSTEGPLYYTCLQQNGTQRRISFQHDQSVAKRKLAIGMKYGIEWLKAESKREGCTELIFKSEAPSLIAFFEHFGFRPAPDNDFIVSL